MATNYNSGATSIGAALKIQYDKPATESLIFNECNLLKDLPKDTGMVGKWTEVPVYAATAQTRSADVTVAAALSSSSTSVPLVKSFQITPVQNHDWASIDHLTMKMARNDAGSFWETVKMRAKACIINVGRDIGRSLYRSGYGSLSTIASNDGAATVTLSAIDDSIAFQPGTQVVFSASESGNTLRGSGGVLTVASVDYDLGKITFTANISTVSAVNGDYIFARGDRQDSATPARLKIAGLDAWGPASAASSDDSFFGCNRSSSSLLQFARESGSLSSPEEAIRKGALKLARRGFKPDKFYVSWSTIDQIQSNLGGQRQFVGDKDAETGFRNIVLNTPAGPVEVVGDYFCQDNVAWGLTLNTFTLHSQGDLIALMDDDGISSLRGSTTNDLTIRYYSYANLSCNLPGANVRVALT